MQADTFRWSMDSAGDWLCIQTKDARRTLDSLKPGKVYDVEIKEHREKRSLDSNAYAWLLIDRLAEKLRIPKTEIYRRYIREIGGNNETVCVTAEAADKLRSGWEHNGLGWQTDTICRMTTLSGSAPWNTNFGAEIRSAWKLRRQNDGCCGVFGQG